MARESASRTRNGTNDDVDRSRRRFLGAAAGASAAALLPATDRTRAASTTDGTVTLVHDTHFHGRFRDASADELSLARYYSVVEELLADADNGLFVGNGDDFAPSMLGLEYEGEHMVEALNHTDLAVDGVGNHEFDFGADVATTRFEESEFPWVVANLLDDAGDPVPGTERWTTLEAGGLTVGVFGLVSENFHSLTDYPAEWQVLGYVEASQEAVESLREDGADVVVCASHVSTGVHETLAREVDGLDAIVGSHSGVVFDEPDIVDGTVISEFGDEFDHVGAITLDAEGGLVDWRRTDLLLPDSDPDPEVEEYDQINVRYTDEIEPDEGLADLADEWLADLEERLGQPAFESEVELDATFNNYAIETNWGNLMTDAMRNVGEIGDIEVDIAANNAGGIRSDSTYGPGEITGADVMDILPFPNEILVVEATGQQVIDYLEEALRPHPAPDFGAQPAIQVSGLSYEWTGHGDDAGVENVFVGGEPIDPEATYTFAHNDYSIGNSEVLSEAEVVLESGQFQGPFVLEQLEQRDTVAPERENRMIRVDETVDAASVARDGDEITLTAPVPEGAAEVGTDPADYRAVIRTGDDLEPTAVNAEGDTIDVIFDAASLTALVEGVDDPALRLFGGYDPDQDDWAYDYEVPNSSGYDRFRFKAPVDAAAVLEGAQTDESGDESDNDSSSDDDDSGESSSDGTEDADGDSVPGFGPLAAVTGGSAGAYLYARGRSSDSDGRGKQSKSPTDE
ncbi:bifunctional metallophosphatase/5'-nucleotidase [Halopiger aswanensis]|uniref:2',3'-cyclic-nucleotide 2'-phosphodiesterase (5'-nucleotidase family) n=1 Tax=Halopiger aswanensis TaxID=148449 RepID=A0A419VY07_9EURY|nr:5'-nucleotidase C-terminal domain-containing protein [Halopiger aswanensis]RKD88105.1 2',3'-cyclic-nucleotide 2'-phosphodiesterase (5'-nucleotidase family) [Halopiger aswanensis]